MDITINNRIIKKQSGRIIDSFNTSNYIKNFIHDIRAPLTNTALIAQNIFAETRKIAKNNNLPLNNMKTIDSYVETIKSQVVSANKMIRDFSNVNSENNINATPHNLKQILERKITSYQQTNSYGIRTYELYYSIPEEIFFLDKIKMERIIENLLSNSTKFTDNGMIIIEVLKKNSKIIIIVKDSGIGIAKEDVPHVFKHGFCGNNNRTISGSGIGLYNVKNFVKLHKGKIEIGSIKGKGTAIKMSFPFLESHNQN